MAALRFKMVEEAVKRKNLKVVPRGTPAPEYWGINVFNREKIVKYYLFSTKFVILLINWNCTQRMNGGLFPNIGNFYLFANHKNV